MTTKRKMDLLTAVKQILSGYDDLHIPENEVLHRISELPWEIQKTDLADVKIEKNEGIVKIMSVGRANGENCLLKAMLCALLSPMLYGFNIYKATGAIINIYTNLELEILIGELQEVKIESFIDEISPTVDAELWMEFENPSGEDVKVEIIATWQEDRRKK